MKKRVIERTMFHDANFKIFQRAEELRNNMTLSEKTLWDNLSNKKLMNLRFKAQHPISQFIVDFYCHKAKLIIEIDGGIHNKAEVIERDVNREYELQKKGFKIIRFTNEEVLKNIDYVLRTIKLNIENKNL